MAFNCTGRQWSDQSVSEKRVVVMLTDCFGTDAIQILSSCEQLPWSWLTSLKVLSHWTSDGCLDLKRFLQRLRRLSARAGKLQKWRKLGLARKCHLAVSGARPARGRAGCSSVPLGQRFEAWLPASELRAACGWHWLGACRAQIWGNIQIIHGGVAERSANRNEIHPVHKGWTWLLFFLPSI